MSPIPNLMIPFLVLLLIIWGEHLLMDLDLLGGWLLINELGIIVPSKIISHIVLGVSRNQRTSNGLPSFYPLKMAVFLPWVSPVSGGHCAPCRGRWLVDWSSHGSSHRVYNYSV